MAVTYYNPTDPQSVKLWNNRVYEDFVTDTYMLSSMLESGIVSKQDQPSRGAGDNVTVSFLQKQEGYGLVGNQAASGQEQPLLYFTDQVIIDLLRYPIGIPNTMTISQQRVVYDFPEDAYRSSMNWLSERAIISVFNQLAGFNPNSFTWGGLTYTNYMPATKILQGMNPISAPSLNRVYYPNNLTSDEEVSQDSTATFKLSDIHQLEYMASTLQPYIRPISESSGIKYHLYVHTSVWISMLQDTQSPLQFRDVFTGQIQSGDTNGTIARSFDYSQTRIFVSDKLPQGIDNSGNVLSNVRRSVFCGRDAAVLSLGQGYNDGTETVPGFIIREESYDIQNLRRMAINAIWGIKKVRFASTQAVPNSTVNIDHGVIVMSNYTNLTYQS